MNGKLSDELSEYLNRRNLKIKKDVYNTLAGKYGEAELEAALMVIANKMGKLELSDPVDSDETPVINITPQTVENYFNGRLF